MVSGKLGVSQILSLVCQGASSCSYSRRIELNSMFKLSCDQRKFLSSYKFTPTTIFEVQMIDLRRIRCGESCTQLQNLIEESIKSNFFRAFYKVPCASLRLPVVHLIVQRDF